MSIFRSPSVFPGEPTPRRVPLHKYPSWDELKRERLISMPCPTRQMLSFRDTPIGPWALDGIDMGVRFWEESPKWMLVSFGVPLKPHNVRPMKIPFTAKPHFGLENNCR